MDTDACKIWSVAEFFGSYGKTLQKPEYQRDYEWEPNHVETLLNDLLEFKREEATRYRLGCIILYDNKESHDVIDGQQRLITLKLIREVLSSGEGKVDKDIREFYSPEKVKENRKSIENWFNTHSVDEKNWIRQLVSDDKFDKAIEIVVIVVGELAENH